MNKKDRAVGDEHERRVSAEKRNKQDQDCEINNQGNQSYNQHADNTYRHKFVL